MQKIHYPLLNHYDILKLLWNIHMICNTFTKILTNIIQEKKRKVLIVFDNIIADIINNKKLNPMVTELFFRGRKRNLD